MAIFTFDSVDRDTHKKLSTSNPNRKVVNIEEYRGTILLPARRPPQPTLPLSQWTSDPLSAA
jgi:hypothetical protein